MLDQPVLCCVVRIPHQQLGWLSGLRQWRWRGHLLLRKLSTLCRSSALRVRNRSGDRMGSTAVSCCTTGQSRKDCMHLFWIGRAVEIQEAVDQIIHSDLALRMHSNVQTKRAKQLPFCSGPRALPVPRMQSGLTSSTLDARKRQAGAICTSHTPVASGYRRQDHGAYQTRQQGSGDLTRLTAVILEWAGFVIAVQERQCGG